MREKLRSPIPLKELLVRAFSEKKRPADPKVQLYELQQKWSAMVGPSLGDHTWPVQISGKKLVVSVKGSAWTTELQLMHHDLLKRINGHFPELSLETLRFRVSQ